MTTCARCKRPLTDPVSIKRQMGPDCWSLIMGEIERSSTNSHDIIDLPFDPDTMDIRCQRDAAGNCHFNIPQRVVLHSPTGMEWNYGGSGPADFALSILCLFTSREVAERNHQDFKWQFISGLPREGGVISGVVIRRWLRERYTDGEYQGTLFMPEFETAAQAGGDS